jgi:hypothetical protein
VLGEFFELKIKIGFDYFKIFKELVVFMKEQVKN